MRNLGRAMAAVCGLGLMASAGLAQSGAFTYQGELRALGQAVTGTKSIRFRVYPTESGGAPVGIQTVNNVGVEEGRFSVVLNGAGELGRFLGQDAYLELTVDGTVLSPRQRLTGAPFAGGPWAYEAGNVTYAGRAAVRPANETGAPTARLLVQDGTNMANSPTAASYTPFKIWDGGTQAMLFDSNQIESVGGALYLNHRATDGSGQDVVMAYGGGNVNIGISTGTGRLNVGGDATFGGSLSGVTRVEGNGLLTLAGSPSSVTTWMLNSTGNLGRGYTYGNVGLNLRASASENSVLRVEDPQAGGILQIFNDHRVQVYGDFSVSNGSKNFIIDHPLEPLTKNLAHNAVEGPGYYTHYQGNVVMGADGSAWVVLPDYFGALNAEPVYQLTAVGQPAGVYVAEEVRGNRFRIAGGKPGQKVSWVIDASRQDPYAKDHPYVVEREKETPGTLLYER